MSNTEKNPLMELAAIIRTGADDSTVTCAAERLGVSGDDVRCLRADLKQYGKPLLRAVHDRNWNGGRK